MPRRNEAFGAGGAFSGRISRCRLFQMRWHKKESAAHGTCLAGEEEEESESPGASCFRGTRGTAPERTSGRWLCPLLLTANAGGNETTLAVSKTWEAVVTPATGRLHLLSTGWPKQKEESVSYTVSPVP